MKKSIFCVLSVTIVLILNMAGYSYAVNKFPLRKKYAGLKFIETKELFNEYSDVIIVDVRSKLEFDVVHITKALHVPISSKDFYQRLEKVRDEKGKTKIVFYCNGSPCEKNYQATKRAMEMGFENVYAYDAGVFTWISVHPELGILLGDSPVDRRKIISEHDFEARMLDFKEFKAKSKRIDAIVIDVREPFQRKHIPDFDEIKLIPMDELIHMLKAREFKDNELYIFDAVGEQVRWLQYHLEKQFYENYYFLRDGVGQ